LVFHDLDSYGTWTFGFIAGLDVWFFVVWILVFQRTLALVFHVIWITTLRILALVSYTQAYRLGLVKHNDFLEESTRCCLIED